MENDLHPHRLATLGQNLKIKENVSTIENIKNRLPDVRDPDFYIGTPPALALSVPIQVPPRQIKKIEIKFDNGSKP